MTGKNVGVDIDLDPTKASGLYLHGDRLWTPEAVQRLRQELE